MRLADGVGASVRGLLERRNRLARTALRQQGQADDMQRTGMSAVACQHVAGYALRDGGLPILNSGHRALEGILDRSDLRPVTLFHPMLLLHQEHIRSEEHTAELQSLRQL